MQEKHRLNKRDGFVLKVKISMCGLETATSGQCNGVDEDDSKCSEGMTLCGTSLTNRS
jgi:hypothetical protein